MPEIVPDSSFSTPTIYLQRPDNQAPSARHTTAYLTIGRTIQRGRSIETCLKRKVSIRASLPKPVSYCVPPFLVRRLVRRNAEREELE